MIKLGFCSTFNPIKSGISDFSEELIFELKKKMDIDLFYNVKPNRKEILQNFMCYPICDLYTEEVREKYDAIVYHMGNNYDYHMNISKVFLKFPGFLELHDISLHNFLAAETYLKKDYEGYVEAVRYSHGDSGAEIAKLFLGGSQRAPWETHALELTTNKHYIERAKGVIVHSEMAKQMTRGICPNVPVVNIPLHAPEIIDDPESHKRSAKKALHIKENTLVFGSFGYATSAKRILQTMDALALFKKMKTKDFRYFVVGKAEGINIEKKAKELGLQKEVMVTGFTSLEDFNTYMCACDFCFNLRYPTHGESSASLHRMLGLGKPVIVSSIGTFEEYPDNIVIKVRYDENEVQDIYSAICSLTKQKKELIKRGECALQFARENCDLAKNAERYVSFFEAVEQGTFQDSFMERTMDKLFDLGLTDDQYIEHLIKDRKIQYLF